MKNLHLVCNAHLDPVWLWDWEEGIAASISTFRMAAKFCREYDGFVFNHNEALLYQWVEEYEPSLFREIQALVRLKKWHIMGGWFLQPDCNMPSGESFLRQIETGRKYFLDKFGVKPTTTTNFDPFGHTRGLVQILKKTGFDSYICCRPNQEDCPLPSNDFIWVGFDGSEVMVHRSIEHYNSGLGHAEDKINAWIAANEDAEDGILLWGVGNHGGGPSYQDLNRIKELQNDGTEWNLIHSVPENYFRKLSEKKEQLPRVEKGINSWGVGCYTSQIRVKQKHRKLESELYMTEKMACQADMAGKMDYPFDELKEAERSLLLCEFHDILPGSAIETVEESSLQLMDHGLELASRIKTKAFFAMAQGQKPAEEDEYPILIYNPHPFEVRGNFCCEFIMADQHYEPGYGMPVMYQDGDRIPCQPEKEASNINLEWRKKVCFSAVLKPASVNRFGARIEWQQERPPKPILKGKTWKYTTDDLEVIINLETGRMDSLVVGGKQWLKPGAFALEVMESNGDTWGSLNDRYTTKVGEFVLADEQDNKHFSGITGDLNSVRVIECGEVRTIVEAVFSYGKSAACIRYILPAQGTAIEVEVEADWNERRRFLKLNIPTTLEGAEAVSETAFGIQTHEKTRKECVGQRWAGLVDAKSNMAFTCINDGTYGMDFEDGDMRISLLHSASYSTLPVGDRPLFREDRMIPYIDQGRRKFRFCINMGGADDRLSHIAQEATIFHEQPLAVAFSPSGEGGEIGAGITLSNPVISLVSFRKAENGCYKLRLFENTGAENTVEVYFPTMNITKAFSFHPFEVKCIELDITKRRMEEIPFC